MKVTENKVKRITERFQLPGRKIQKALASLMQNQRYGW